MRRAVLILAALLLVPPVALDAADGPLVFVGCLRRWESPRDADLLARACAADCSIFVGGRLFFTAVNIVKLRRFV